ncbi:unnamed protein product, partial [Didymodactylos carnosus]
SSSAFPPAPPPPPTGFSVPSSSQHMQLFGAQQAQALFQPPPSSISSSAFPPAPPPPPTGVSPFSSNQKMHLFGSQQAQPQFQPPPSTISSLSFSSAQPPPRMGFSVPSSSQHMQLFGAQQAQAQFQPPPSTISSSAFPPAQPPRPMGFSLPPSDQRMQLFSAQQAEVQLPPSTISSSAFPRAQPPTIMGFSSNECMQSFGSQEAHAQFQSPGLSLSLLCDPYSNFLFATSSEQDNTMSGPSHPDLASEMSSSSSFSWGFPSAAANYTDASSLCHEYTLSALSNVFCLDDGVVEPLFGITNTGSNQEAVDRRSDELDLVLLSDVAQSSIGVETVDKEMACVLRRNAEIPSRQIRDSFTNAYGYQHTGIIKIFEADDNDTPLLARIKETPFSSKLIESLFQLQNRDGSFSMSNELGELFNNTEFDIVERKLVEQGLNSLAEKTRNEIRSLICTACILFYFLYKSKLSSKLSFPVNINSIKRLVEIIRQCVHTQQQNVDLISQSYIHECEKAVDYVLSVRDMHAFYCKHMELSSSWELYIQQTLLGLGNRSTQSDDDNNNELDFRALLKQQCN